MNRQPDAPTRRHAGADAPFRRGALHRSGAVLRRASALLALALTAGLAGGTATAQTGSPIIQTTSGYVQGGAPDARGVTAFRGIPYAAPPVGPLRWRPPQPAPGWSDTRQATSYGNICLAAPGSPTPPNPPQSEDCLTLNIWTNAPYTGAAKPVMVWFHGGGFQFGSGASPTYNGSPLASRDVIVVTLNYRLGPFGFLAHPSLDAESGSSGAWGLQDQLAALRWVQQNIANFGGDPTRVTMFGESAGAHAVGMLLTSPGIRGLVSGAIAESGAFWDSEHGSLSTHQEALAHGTALFNRFAGQDPRSVPAAQINAVGGWDNVTDPGITAFSPSVDGQVLTDSPADVFLRGAQLNVPLLAGWNTAEYFLFQPRALPASSPQAFRAATAQLFGNRCGPLIDILYPAGTTPQTAQAASDQLDGDLVIAEQTWEMVSALRRPGGANTYAYRFSYTSPYSPVASHTAELPFVFGTLTPQRFIPGTSAPTAADAQLSATMMSYWTNFARQGDPNGPGLPTWPVHRGPGSPVMQLSATPGAGPDSDALRFLFIASYRRAGRFPDAWRTLGAGVTQNYSHFGCGYDHR